MRLIDAEEVYKILTEYYHHRTDMQHTALKEALDRVPIIEAESARMFGEVEKWLVHGHWIGKSIGGYSTVRCSVCGDVFLENNGKWNYCPNCGAKMDEVNE